MRPVVILGVDGGSWNVLCRMIRNGHMPNLKQIINSGVRGVLRSVVPPVTGSAWLSLATGLNPGKTGVVDFFKRVRNFQLGLVSSADYEGISIWDYASYEGLNVGILNYPLLYPPYPVNGFMVSGLGSLGMKPSTWPLSLRERLEFSNALYDVSVDYHLDKYNVLDKFFEDVENHMRGYLNALKLLADSKLDLFVTVVQASDWVFHRLWAYIDEDHPLHSKLPREDILRTKRWFGEFWSMVDEAIEVILDRYGSSGNIFIISDHGFGPQYGVFNLARWLVEEGFMRLKGGPFQRVSLSLKRRILVVGRKIIGILPTFAMIKLSKTGRKILNFRIEDYIDIAGSTALALGHAISSGAIYMLKNEMSNKIVEKLRETFDNLGLRVSIWETRKLYNGDKAVVLPDIIFLVEDGRVVILQDILDLSKPLYMDRPYSPRHTGSHRLEGIIAAYGNDIVHRNDPINADILDIAPTVMYLLNLPIPSNMDGNVIRGIMREKGEPKYVSVEYYYKLKLAFRARHILKRKAS